MRTTPKEKLLFPYALSTYRRLLLRFQSRLGLDVGWTPHSPRAGYATESTAARVPFDVIRNTMRHSSEASLKAYIDIVGATAVALNVKAAGLSEAIGYARAHWLKYVDEKLLVATYHRC